MSSFGEVNYAIVDRNGYPLTAGVGEHEIGRLAQDLADERGEEVAYYEEPDGEETWVRPARLPSRRPLDPHVERRSGGVR